MRRLTRALCCHIDWLLICLANQAIHALRRVRSSAIQRQDERHIATIEEETTWPSQTEITP